MSENLLEGNVEELKITAIIGFDGSNLNGFLVCPDKKHVIYPMGNKVTIQEWETKKQHFLFGHTNIISAIDVSRSGKYIASGQINHIGFKAMVIIWDFHERKKLYQYEPHKVRVEAIAFSIEDKYVISLGGRDCGAAVVWNMEKGCVLCGSTVARGVQGDAIVLKAMNQRNRCFFTGGENHLAIWRIDPEARSVTLTDVRMPKVRRFILCAEIDERDEFAYCGTTTGDIVKIMLNYSHDVDIIDCVKQPFVCGVFAKISKKKLPRGVVSLYSKGILAIKRLFSGKLIIGAGDGTVELVQLELDQKLPLDPHVKYPSVPALKVLKSNKVLAAVTSIQMLSDDIILAATTRCEIFSIDMKTFDASLMVTCHTSAIYDIAFPHNFSEVFATASKDDVRVWSMFTMQELLRIQVQNFSCSAVVFAYDGKSILTAWNDGVIRSFTPLTGRLIYALLNAHNKGVSALATTSHGQMLVSGGCEGQVRLWSVSPMRQELMCTLKEHKGPVSAIHINLTDSEAASASTDGTCIIWDLKRQCRMQILFANTLFMCVRYFPSGVQILTGGSDRKIAYWEVFDGSLVRELEGSPSGAINTVDISPDGDTFISGGNDQIVKLWKYQEGITTHIGLGHSGVITASSFSPDQKYIVTSSASGSVFVWDNPNFLKTVETQNESKTPMDEKGDMKKDQDEHIGDLISTRSRSSSKECICKSKSSLSSQSSSSSSNSSSTGSSRKNES